jgi:hypothetical protein
MPRKERAARRLAKGVKNPMTKAAPLALNSRPRDQRSKPGTDAAEKYNTPAARDVAPIAARSSNNPSPGFPPGNVENSLCSERSLERQLQPVQLKDMERRIGPESSKAEYFRNSFEVYTFGKIP